MLKVGADFSRYLNPDFLYCGNIAYTLNYFTNYNYGSFSNIYLNNGFYYDLNNIANIGLNLGIDSFSDSINDNANYFSYSIAPKISYDIFPDSIIGLTNTYTNTNYYKANTSATEQKLGVYFSRKWIPGLIISFSNNHLSTIASVISSNYSGNQSTIVLEYEINPISNLSSSYSYSKLDYANWHIPRVDSISYFNLAYGQKINTDFTFNLIYEYTNNESTDNTSSYSQNIFQMFFELTLPTESHANILFDQAYNLHQQKQYLKAIPMFEISIKLEPTKTEAYYLLSYCYLKTHQKEKAIQLLQKYLINNHETKLHQILDAIILSTI